MTDRTQAELERRLQNVTERLLAAFEELDFVHSMAEVLGRPEGIQDLEGYLLRETMVIFRSQGGWVLRREPDGGFRTATSMGFDSRTVERLNRSLILPRAERQELPFLVDDLPRSLVQQGETIGDSPGSPDADLPRAFLVAPLELDAEILGAVCLGKRQPGDVFTAGDSKLLSTLATQAALYVKNAMLLDRFRAEARTLGKRVRELESDARARPHISWIRGPSSAMKRVADQVEAAAASDATVLLLGDSGTGKSLVARVLHRMSARQDGPFVELNCGAVPPGLIESELFGHVRGAFTGADRTRPGLFEEAERGTIFLDEIAEMPLEAQVKLLNVLERRRVRRVGENRDRTIDARVVAATNADLSHAVREGKFREDLFYRLNVISLTVPPLRQRREDILHLARKFLEDLARETNRRVQGFTPEAEAALLAYSWPGNVRELRNVVERSLLLKTKGGQVGKEDLPLGPEGGGRSALPTLDQPLPDMLLRYEKQVILSALEHHGGVVSKAAEELGISRTNLHNKLRKHGLVRAHSWNDESNN